VCGSDGSLKLVLSATVMHRSRKNHLWRLRRCVSDFNSDQRGGSQPRVSRRKENFSVVSAVAHTYFAKDKKQPEQRER